MRRETSVEGAVRGAGIVVLRLDPEAEKFRVFKLPADNEGIGKMVVDARGRLWYMGSHTGKLGVIE
jgi:virginiamycin B lyase